MSDIELIIKIPEEIYKASQIIDVKYEDVVQIPLEVIQNGTPLPKGHGDLIDRKELLKQLIDKANYPSNYVRIAPTIIEADSESEDIISEDITKAGSQIEMLVDGTWIKGTVVEGYRYQDGIVTIETADGHRYWCGQDRTDIYRRNNC